jgi:predicted DNA-binding protein
MVGTTRQHHVRLSEDAHRTLMELSQSTGVSMATLVERAIEAFRREQLFAAAEAAWQAIHADPAARAEFDAEYALWDTTVADGLQREDW